MVTRSHYRKVRTRRITAQSDDADVWRVSLCQGCADNCSPVAVKSDETLSCEGETNPPPPSIGAAAVPISADIDRVLAPSV